MRELSSGGVSTPAAIVPPMRTLGEIADLIHGWFPPATAESWDRVGLVVGDRAAGVRRILLAVDPTLEVVREAAAYGADLLITHHPLLLRGVHGVATDTPKGRIVTELIRADCALLCAHTNADRARGGVAEAMADALGLADVRPLVADPYEEPAYDVVALRRTAPAETGIGRVGAVAPLPLRALADRVAAAVPATAHGIRVSGDPDRVVQRVAVSPGAGDSLFDAVLAAGADVYVTSDLRHHPAAEFIEREGTAVIDVSHWASEWLWLPALARRLDAALGAGAGDAGATVESRVSTLVTDPWTFRI